MKRIYQEAPSATVIGIDNMNAYYAVALKEFRLSELVKGETIKIFNYGNCKRDFGYKPSTSLQTGLRKFAEWYAEFYK